MKIRKSLIRKSLVGMLLAISAWSCSKNETVTVAKPEFKAGQVITGTELSGSVKGTMKSGQTYYFSAPITVNAGDTLVMQSGVKLLARDPAAQIIVNGVFISLGTKDKPNWITGVSADANPSQFKLTIITDPNIDPGLKPNGKLWGGIQCSTTCSMLNIKWTHLDFAGGNVGTAPLPGYAQGDDLFVTLFQNPKGIYILEDSWIYGSTTDAARIKGGLVHIMRNTVEKIAYNDGDAFNVKGSTVGDMAFNLLIGTAKGGTKASNKGSSSLQTNINMYNNTYINGGWRSVDPDRGANVNYEEGARGKAFNNIMVNCRTGLRILENPAADTVNMYYGNTLAYGDSVSVVNQIYPPTHATKPQTSDIPTPSSSWYPKWPTGYKKGQVYNAPQLVGQNNPNFVNFSLPSSAPHLRDINFAGSFDFRLKSGSPAIGKGFTGFSPLDATASISNSDLKATVTPPNIDLGAYPTDGSGNKH